MSEDASRLRRKMVSELVRAGLIRSASVEAAFTRVPRHVFTSRGQWPTTEEAKAQEIAKDLQAAYEPQRSVIIRWGPERPGVSTCASAPWVMAEMIESLRVSPGDRILEIGSGTGYNAALLADLVGTSGSVTTVEFVGEVAQLLRGNLREASVDRIELIVGDGGQRVREGAPFSKLIAAASVRAIPPSWIAQLAIGGTMIVPWRFSAAGQAEFVCERTENGLAGTLAHQLGFVALGGPFGYDEDQEYINGPRHREMRALQSGGRAQLPMAIGSLRNYDRGSLNGAVGFAIWASLQEPTRMARVVAMPRISARDIDQVPWFALWDQLQKSLAIIYWDGSIDSFGTNDMIERLLALYDEWARAGSPKVERFGIVVQPADGSKSTHVHKDTAGVWQLQRGQHNWTVTVTT